MVDYGYKSFLENEKNGDVFTPTLDTNSQQWDSMLGSSSTTPAQDTNTPTYTTPVNSATPTITPQTQDPADKQRADYIQARIDIANAPTAALQDSDNTYTSKLTGQVYDKPKESHSNDAYLGVMGYLAGYLRNMDVGEGMDGAYSAVASNQNQVDRFKQIGYYEQKGYNPADIATYVKTGKDDRLVANKAQWQSAGGGYIFNAATGEFKSSTGTNNKAVDKTVDLGDRVQVFYKDGTSEYQAKGMTPEQGQNVRTVDLGDRIETYDANNNLISSQPKGAAPNNAASGGAAANKQQNANAQQQASFDQQNKDLDKLSLDIKNAPDSAFAVNTPKQFGTGTIPGIASTVAAAGYDWYQGGNQNAGAAINQADNQITGIIRGIITAKARADGQVGIDRDTEVDNLLKKAPQVDYTATPAVQRQQQQARIDWVRNQMVAPIQWTTGHPTNTTTAPSQGGSSTPAQTGNMTTPSGISYSVRRVG